MDAIERYPKVGDQGFACPQCFPGRVEYGELIPGHFLVEHEGKYLLLTDHGHLGDEVISWTVRPYPEPGKKSGLDAFTSWCDSSRYRDVCLPPDVGERLCAAARKAGWRPKVHETVVLWLYKQAAKLLELQSTGSV